MSKVEDLRPRWFWYSENFKDKNLTTALVSKRDCTIDGITSSTSLFDSLKASDPFFLLQQPWRLLM